MAGRQAGRQAAISLTLEIQHARPSGVHVAHGALLEKSVAARMGEPCVGRAWVREHARRSRALCLLAQAGASRHVRATHASGCTAARPGGDSKAVATQLAAVVARRCFAAAMLGPAATSGSASRSALLGSHASCPGPPCHSQRQLVLIAGVVGQGLGLLGRLVKVLLRGCRGMARVEMPLTKDQPAGGRPSGCR